MNKPQTLDQLKSNIRQEIENIPVEILKKVIKNSIKRADLCRTAKGGYLVDIIFENRQTKNLNAKKTYYLKKNKNLSFISKL